VSAKYEVRVGCSGLVPEREYSVHLQIGNQEFQIQPTYCEIDENAEIANDEAQWMADQLRAALATIVKEEEKPDGD